MDGGDQFRLEGQFFDWHAWHDHEPPGPATLRVTGKCTFRTTGYGVKLRRSELQENNPWPGNLLLELIVEAPPPGTHVGQGFTTLDVRYKEETDVEYETVTILSGSVTTRVEDVT